MEHLDQIVGTFSDLDAWGERTAAAFVPAHGSELEVDDRDWPPVRLSQVAAMGLGSARDHLHAIRVHLDARELFPFAQLSLCRAALIGGAQAVWVLGPSDRDLRLERARCVAAHMYAEHQKYLNVLRSLAPEPHQGTEIVSQTVQERLAELDEVREKSGHRARLNTTLMIEEAARHAFGTPTLVETAVSVWRLTSGSTHGFAWSLLGQPDTAVAGSADADGVAAFEAGGGIDRLANNYMCAFHMARRGWQLFDHRGGSAPRIEDS